MREPAPLFDAESLRTSNTPCVLAPEHPEPLLVLGSTTPSEALDLAGAARDGLALRRRRGGGGAVLLRPEDGWVEVWWPAGEGGVPTDVRVTARVVGECCRAALAHLGQVAEVHAGALARAKEGSVACFAGLGPGELLVDGRKLVGLSQWRVREGALISLVIAQRAPSELARYVADEHVCSQLAAASTSLDEREGDATATAWLREVRDALASMIGVGATTP